MPTPYWLAESESKHYPALEKDLTVDVAVIGGGITGVTTAYFLKRAGLKVALVERGRCGEGETGHTSAHLAYVPDRRINELERTFGRGVAQAVLDAGQTAIRTIEKLSHDLEIDCGFVSVPGFLHTPWDDEDPHIGEGEGLRRDAELAVEFGYPATFVESIPIADRPGVQFADQALFHPTKYLAGLLKRVSGGGGHVFEQTEVEKIDGSHTLHCRGGKISCDHLVAATHFPMRGNASSSQFDWLQTHLACYSSYVLSAWLPQGRFQPALYWDTASPYNYLRFQDVGEQTLAVFGGEDHKTGQVRHTTEPFHRLEERWARIFPQARPAKHWSGQVIETNDGLPMIGAFGPRQYLATGYGGNGLTFGTAAALMIRDEIIQAANPWRQLFRPDRLGFKGGVWSYLSENIDYPRFYVQDRITPVEADSLDDVPIGAGRIVRLDGERVAAYRDPSGHVTCCSAVCTHMGCLVRWNGAERTWDCPCHGSRFKPTGEVISGPAQSPLEEHAAAKAQH